MIVNSIKYIFCDLLIFMSCFYLALLMGQHGVKIEASIFGKRDGVLTGLAVTASDRGNVFKSTRGWKQGVVHSVEMLQNVA